MIERQNSFNFTRKELMFAFIRKNTGKRKLNMEREMYRLLRINRKLSISKKVRF